MEIRARKKKAAPETQPRTQQRKKTSPKLAAVPPAPEPERAGGHYPEAIGIRCNTMLYHTIQNMLSASHAAQDFTYASATDVIRAALQAYKDGMELTELDQKGAKTLLTIRTDPALKQFYASLPDRMRTKILERAIRSYLKTRR